VEEKGWIDIQPFLIDAKSQIARYSTAFAFNNPTNSRKSLVSGIRVATIAEFDHELEPLLPRHTRVSAGIRFVGLLKTRKDSNLFLHR
jgi:hypothetical protein